MIGDNSVAKYPLLNSYSFCSFTSISYMSVCPPVWPNAGQLMVALRRADGQTYVDLSPFLRCLANIHVLPWANVGPT